MENIQVRHRRTCREARAPKELSYARLCDPPEAQLSAAGNNPLLKVVVNRKHKDVLFRIIFRDKGKLLELYNAVNGTNYKNVEELEIITLEDAIYMNVKNDIAFLIGSQINLYEHQSTWNPNMPVRCLIYIAKEYDKLVDNKSLYSRKLQKLPTPRFVVFYNGKPEQPERQTLCLSSAFEISVPVPELELKMTVYNINHGKNQKLMEQCRTLEEYSLFVDKLRRYSLEYSIEEAAQITVDECIKENILKDILESHRAEVIEMSIFYYDEEKELELIRQDEFEMGQEDGIKIGEERGFKLGVENGRQQEKKGLVENLLRQGILSPEQIVEAAEVSLDYVKKIQAEMIITICNCSEPSKIS